MKRDYEDGVSENITYFIGNEVEHTPAYGLKTLFVTGLQPIEEIQTKLTHAVPECIGISHIFFGANHSFKPTTSEEWRAWEEMICYFLDQDYLCSLDIPISAVEEFNEGPLNDHFNFIPQIRVPIPYVKLWNYNTMLKIDDKDFKATNPGVWSHSLHDLKDRSKFTDWLQYKNDKILKR